MITTRSNLEAVLRIAITSSRRACVV